MPTTTLIETLRTRGIDRRLMNGVLRHKRHWRCVSGFFCLPGTEFFAVGFVANHMPSGGELLQFALPLYVQDFECHLNYAERLPQSDGDFNVGGKSPDEMGEEFLAKANSHIEKVRRRDSLSDFASFVESLDALRNTRIRYVYGLTLIMLERPQEAAEHLSAVADSDWEKRVVPNEAHAASALLREMESEGEGALATLTQWADYNRSELGLLQQDSV